MTRESDKFINENFTNVSLSLNNLWMYQVRKNILKTIDENTKYFNGTVLDLGCGIMPYKKRILQNKKVNNYIGLDLENTTYYADVKPDLFWDGSTIPLEDGSVECIIASEVLEHCHNPEIVLAEAMRVLKNGGVFFCTVPFIWHLHEVPFDEYRYTPFSLEKKLKSVGFCQISIKPLGGWDSALSQLLGLWITFRPMKRFYKSILLRVLFFVIRKLEKTDSLPTQYDNKANSMISGLAATAYKK